MIRLLAIAALAFSSAAAGQGVSSYLAANQAPVKGDSHKIVCKKEETIGTRLGAKKVCLTVAEWNEITTAHRERTERIQSGTCTVGEGQACLDPR